MLCLAWPQLTSAEYRRTCKHQAAVVMEPAPEPPSLPAIAIPAEAKLCAANAGEERANGYYKRDGARSRAAIRLATAALRGVHEQ